jgi:hypothetical protein
MTIPAFSFRNRIVIFRPWLRWGDVRDGTLARKMNGDDAAVL